MAGPCRALGTWAWEPSSEAEVMSASLPTPLLEYGLGKGITSFCASSDSPLTEAGLGAMATSLPRHGARYKATIWAICTLS